MSKRNKAAHAMSACEEEIKDSSRSVLARRSTWMIAAIAWVSVLTLGVFAKNGWFPSTDPFTGKKTGWFGQAIAKNASSSWNPLAAPLPTPTPQLAREYVYAGSRLLAVEDANATEMSSA